MKVTLYLPVRMRSSSNSVSAGIANRKRSAKPPTHSVRASEQASLKRRFQPVSRNRAKKVVMPFQRSFAPSQVSASEESIQESTRSQSMGPLRPLCLKNQSCTFQASRRFAKGAADGGAAFPLRPLPCGFYASSLYLSVASFQTLPCDLIGRGLEAQWHDLRAPLLTAHYCPPFIVRLLLSALYCPPFIV